MATQSVKVNNESQGGMGSELTGKVTGTLANAREFLHDTRVEMKQVTWPSREDVVATTWVVIATVAFFGVFLWLVDMGVQRVVQYILKRFGV
jgi:preprotein translocase subunit SecE